LYEKGIGVSKDHLKALEWWRKAAQKGDASAQKQMKAWNQTW
jgi:TPR repeat protein